MPYLSDAQRKWAHTPNGIKALGGLSKVAEWDRVSQGKKLPQRVKHKKKVVMSKEEAIKEHEHLVKVLKTGKGLKKEAKKQGKELKEYKHLKVRVNNKIKDYGQEIDKGKKHTIIINKKMNKNPKTLLDTLFHEKFHAQHPKASEKETYKKTAQAMKHMTPAMKKKLRGMLPK